MKLYLTACEVILMQQWCKVIFPVLCSSMLIPECKYNVLVVMVICKFFWDKTYLSTIEGSLPITTINCCSLFLVGITWEQDISVEAPWGSLCDRYSQMKVVFKHRHVIPSDSIWSYIEAVALLPLIRKLCCLAQETVTSHCDCVYANRAVPTKRLWQKVWMFVNLCMIVSTDLKENCINNHLSRPTRWAFLLT